ncbi:hypothetical protein TNCV_3211021 [Trichonephila clavipes]|uniref:Uncharacterized protein n=1 Tax=Trichonephila clavipes TaxID=2585209 RepID=A0A8X6RYH6_TRICX|nr:hypothetical protein TNCV_3211021 [Trichonephila clavipes]
MLCCPVAGCTAPFTTAKWFVNFNSIKRHLRHRHADRRVQYWCAPCGRRLKRTPMKHPCMVNQRQVHGRAPTVKPEGPRQRRARRREELAPLYTGEPGDMRLAPPQAHLPHAQTSPGQNPGGKGAEDDPPKQGQDRHTCPECSGVIRFTPGHTVASGRNQ